MPWSSERRQSARERKKPAYEPHERRDDANGPWQAFGRTPSCWKQWHLSIYLVRGLKKKKERRLVQPFEQQTSLLSGRIKKNNKVRRQDSISRTKNPGSWVEFFSPTSQSWGWATCLSNPVFLRKIHQYVVCWNFYLERLNIRSGMNL